jgi:hypothetical protein
MLIREEAKATRQVLLHLMEIERREIHLARGFKSLHEFAVEVLGYSDGSAARRVAAMRLMRDIPETAEQLVQGTLTLETMSTLQKHFNDTKPSKELRTALVNQAQNLSKRELEKKLGKPEATAVYLKPELVRKLGELKLVFGMTSLERIIEKLADQALAQAKLKEQKQIAKLERERMSSETTDQEKNALGRASSREAQKNEGQLTPPPEQQHGRQAAPPPEQQPARNSTPPPEQQVPIPTSNRDPAVTATANRSRYVRLLMRRHLIQRDQARCMYVDPLSKRGCSETRHLEFDHMQPFSRGGNTTQENLRVLCANHNRFRARRMGLGSPRR